MVSTREVYKYYGIKLSVPSTIWATQTWNNYLVKTYPSSECSSVASSSWTANGVKFLYPHHIQKTYILEGVVEGEICFSNNVVFEIKNYRVTVFKINNDNNESDLVTTGIITHTDKGSVDDYVVHHFWIDAYDTENVLDEYDRIGVKVEWNIGQTVSTVSAKLQHDISTSDPDLWIDIPFLL